MFNFLSFSVSVIYYVNQTLTKNFINQQVQPIMVVNMKIVAGVFKNEYLNITHGNGAYRAPSFVATQRALINALTSTIPPHMIDEKYKLKKSVKHAFMVSDTIALSLTEFMKGKKLKTSKDNDTKMIRNQITYHNNILIGYFVDDNKVTEVENTLKHGIKLGAKTFITPVEVIIDDVERLQSDQTCKLTPINIDTFEKISTNILSEIFYYEEDEDEILDSLPLFNNTIELIGEKPPIRQEIMFEPYIYREGVWRLFPFKNTPVPEEHTPGEIVSNILLEMLDNAWKDVPNKNELIECNGQILV